LAQVKEIAQAHSAEGVEQIVVAVGPLSGVEATLLAEVFRWARIGTCAASAELAFEQTLVRVHCVECGIESPCTANRLLCGECGGFRTRLISGDELHLLRVELSSNKEHAWASAHMN
jgi:hydrogenase nickel incorporation protein HypA/HybF